MRIGIVGIGIVGSAIKYGFKRLGHKVIVHDIKLWVENHEDIELTCCPLCRETIIYVQKLFDI